MTDDRTWADKAAGEILADLAAHTETAKRPRHRTEAFLRDAQLSAAIQATLRTEANRLRTELPRHTGPLAHSAATWTPDTPSPWHRGTDPEMDDGRRRGRRPNPFIHTTNDGMAPRRGPFGRRPRARARVRRCAQWIVSRASQIARSVVGRHPRSRSDPEQNAQSGGSD